MRISPYVRLKYTSQSISMALASAVLEWLLMFMLFLDASFSYLVTKFARYCELQIPCLLCSRLDHVMGKEKKGFYWDLICVNHKLEISSRVVCHIHNKLVDVHEMCENCLFSFAKINKSNAETYRLLVGKMGADPPVGLDQYKDHGLDFSGTRICSCCYKQWISKGYTQYQLHTLSFGSGTEAAEHDESSSIEHHMDEPKKTSDESTTTFRTSDMGKNCCDPLFHVEYSKVKITSDTESEIPSDDDSASALICETDNFEGGLTVECVQMEPCISILADDVVAEKFIHPASPSKPPVFESDVQLETNDPHGIGDGLEELNWQQVDHMVNISIPSELISLDEIPPSNVTKDDISAPSELISFNEDPPSSVTKAFVEVSGESLYVRGAGDVGKDNATESEVISKVESERVTTTETRSEETFVVNDTGSHIPSYLDLGDAYKLAVGTMRRQLSEKILEQRSLKDSTKISEDLMVLLSQMSAARGLELPLNDISPRVLGNSDDIKTLDPSISVGMHLLQRRISLERNESGLSLDGSIVSEIEGEGMVDRLKRQVEHDRKLMGVLYKELEEERSASAVATNQAMAMITRLQEEKSALHMEALQCLRMMEEQAEYDVEAVQKANDLLADKEREIQDLEAELEFYRMKMGNVLMVEDITEPVSGLKGGDIRVEHSDSSCTKHSSNVSFFSVSDKQETFNKFDETDNSTSSKSLFLEFEDERMYILQRLEKLEKKLDLFTNNGVHIVVGNDKGCDNHNFNEPRQFQEIDQTEEIDATISKGSTHLQEECISSPEILQHISKEFSSFKSGKQLVSVVCEETDLVALKKEFSELSGRLEALAADQSFLEHSINSLRNGNEGLMFIQDIASQLRELHRIGIRRTYHHFS